MTNVFMVPPHDPSRVVPVNEFWVDYKTKLGWKRVTPAQAEKITETASTDPTPTKKESNRG